MKAESLTVDVKVGAEIRAWVIAVAGTDILVPERNSVMWCLVKQHLQTVPASYQMIYDRGEYIYIRLLVHGGKTKSYSISAGRNIEVNTLYRSYLDEKGQQAVRRFMYMNFKKSFHSYMMGALRSNPSGKEVAMITEYLLEFNIDVNRQLISRLQKDWIRYKKKMRDTTYNPMWF